MISNEWIDPYGGAAPGTEPVDPYSWTEPAPTEPAPTAPAPTEPAPTAPGPSTGNTPCETGYVKTWNSQLQTYQCIPSGGYPEQPGGTFPTEGCTAPAVETQIDDSGHFQVSQHFCVSAEEAQRRQDLFLEQTGKIINPEPPPGEGGEGGGGEGGGGGGGLPDPTGTPTYVPPASSAAPVFNAPKYNAPGPLDIPDWVKPADFEGTQFEWNQQFNAPDFQWDEQFGNLSAQQMLENDPGYQFRLTEGQKALERSAAGKGTLRTGGTLKDILGYGQDYAAKEYQAAFDRAKTGYDTRFGTAKDVYSNKYRAAGDEYNSAFDAAKTSYGYNSQNAKDIYDAMYGASKDLYSTQYNSATGEYGAASEAAQNAYDAQFQNAQAEYAPGYESWSRENKSNTDMAQFQFEQEWKKWFYDNLSAETQYTAGLK